ncbi:phosphatases II [Cryphonectria parasitica EP155]|uniref:protein-tyrosine-phosphatase n=1 Tax=Cryphonectria parasitica (strain ATCC 38755 / EP155) TaxID=660469 RepID=A0A9P4Y4G4_CRYP1|nr:phosphatases II [Cryphonectria parasitica EP155]KAF3766471.1 phosphatases II [Cryphonectria parasitica EP155]
MKTTRPQPPTASKSYSHTYTSAVSHARSQSTNASKTSTKSSSPAASPRGPLAAGQAVPSKLSSPPSATPRHLLSTTPIGQVTTQNAARTPSPNYFGLKVEASIDADETGAIPRENWSPASSSVKSFGAVLPQQVPLDANPEFEAFRRQADANRGGSGFNLGSSHFGGSSPFALAPGAAPARPQPSRWRTHGSETSPHVPASRPNNHHVEMVKALGPHPEKMDVDTDANSMRDSAYASSDSKRSSEASMNPPSFLNLPRHESPAQMDSSPEKRSGLSKVDDRHPRLSMMHTKADPPSPDPQRSFQGRAATLPAGPDQSVSGMIPPTELKAMLDAKDKNEVLLLDLRVSPQYAQARIKGALNLCIPTTLLKRATFNLQKLAQTFQGDADKEVFGRWPDTKHIVVYDAFSSEKRDAVSAMNTIKKFTNEGYKGTCHILRGGFKAFAAAFPDLIEYGNMAEQKPGRPTLSLPGAAPSIAPVVGGVMLPTAGITSNAFFANIRQNQDLVDGVGQMDINVPRGTDMEALPRWLQEAASVEDHGKQVSDKFLGIERDEQARMKVAYSYINPASVAKEVKDAAPRVQLSGIEKGVKNRYKDILPFDHARVKLEGKPEGTCDYVNASHVQASRSHKKYIASQGPLPATFEDFWSVIWDQDVRVIVMLTAESEGGQLKCHAYWKDREFGPIKLRALSEKKVSLDIDKQGSHSAADSEDTHSSSTAAAQQQEDAFGFGAAMAAADPGRRRANTTTTLETNQQTQAQTKPKAGSSSDTPFVVIRKFALSHAAHPFAPIREITQLHYPSWPDFGTPAQPSHLLALVELANMMQRSNLPIDVPGAISSRHGSLSEKSPKERPAPSPKKRSRSRASSNLPLAWWEEPESDQAVHPMLVHCSAGCGRTGTFCTVDSVIDMLKRQRIRNIRKANDNIERKLRGHKHQAQCRSDSDANVAMAGLSFGAPFQIRGRKMSRNNPVEDALSPSTKSPGSPAFPVTTTSMSISESPSPSCSSSDDDDDPKLDTSWIDDDTIDLISATVHDFRGQRLSMVQTLRQFVLCYETVIEWVWRLQERGGPAGSGVGAPGTGASGTAAMRARGRSGTVAHVGDLSK